MNSTGRSLVVAPRRANLATGELAAALNEVLARTPYRLWEARLHRLALSLEQGRYLVCDSAGCATVTHVDGAYLECSCERGSRQLDCAHAARVARRLTLEACPPPDSAAPGQVAAASDFASRHPDNCSPGRSFRPFVPWALYRAKEHRVRILG